MYLCPTIPSPSANNGRHVKFSSTYTVGMGFLVGGWGDFKNASIITGVGAEVRKMEEFPWTYKEKIEKQQDGRCEDEMINYTADKVRRSYLEVRCWRVETGTSPLLLTIPSHPKEVHGQVSPIRLARNSLDFTLLLYTILENQGSDLSVLIYVSGSCHHFLLCP